MQQSNKKQTKKVKNDGGYFQDELLKVLNCNYYKTFKENLPKVDGYPGWSPNNVRRLVISPDGILIQYHTTVKAKLPNNRLTYIKLFNYEQGLSALNSGKCKPMLKVLGRNRVYSAIEEIVLLSKSGSGLYLLNDELNLQSIGLDNKSDLEESLKSRYARMYGIGVVNNLSLQEFTGKYQNMLSNKNESLIKNMRDNGESMKALIVGGKKAFSYIPNLQRYSNVNGSGYILDSEVLSEHFDKLTKDYRVKQSEAKKQEGKPVVSGVTIKEIRFYIQILSLLGKELSRENARPVVRRYLSDYDNKTAGKYLEKGMEIFDIRSKVVFSEFEVEEPEGVDSLMKNIICYLLKCDKEKLRFFKDYDLLNTYLKVCVFFNLHSMLETAKNSIPSTYDTVLDTVKSSKYKFQVDTSVKSGEIYEVYGRYANVFKEFWCSGNESDSMKMTVNNIAIGVYIIEKVFTRKIKNSDYTISDCISKLNKYTEE